MLYTKRNILPVQGIFVRIIYSYIADVFRNLLQKGEKVAKKKE